MRLNKLKNILLSVVLLFVLALFVISLIISTHKYKNTSYVSSEDVIKYANLFLSDPHFIEKGKVLDCSGFTKNVYKSFSLNLPASANQQYLKFRGNKNALVAGDLVFFSINSKSVNHVGIALNDSLFIHSPGRNKVVKEDNLNSNYWLKYYKGSGRVIN